MKIINPYSQRKLSSHQRNKDLFDSSQWSEGVRWGQDRPQEHVNKDGVELLDSGCCGAIIHGLEDEYYGTVIYFNYFYLSIYL